MNSKELDVANILKLYELRRDEKMRRARAWYFTEFNPASAEDIARIVLSGEEESANYRLVTSYWDMACSFVNNGAIDEKLFADANTEHIFIFAKLQPFLPALREIFGNPAYNANLEEFAMRDENIEAKIAMFRKLSKYWTKENRDKSKMV